MTLLIPSSSAQLSHAIFLLSSPPEFKACLSESEIALTDPSEPTKETPDTDAFRVG